MAKTLLKNSINMYIAQTLKTSIIKKGQFNTVLRFLANEDNKLPLELHSIMLF